MNILIYRWKAYTQFDMIAELARRGHTVDDFSGEMADYEEDPVFVAKLQQMLDAKSYDLVLTANYFSLVSDECEKRGIRYLAWCCDSPISTMYHQSVFNKCNTVLQFDLLNQMEFAEMGAPVYHLPLASAVDRTDKLLGALSDDQPPAYEHEVSFVGSMYRKTNYDEIYEHMTEYQKGYFDAALKMQTNAYGIYLLDDALDGDMMSLFAKNFRLHKSPRSFADLRMTVATTSLAFKIAQSERRNIMIALSKICDVDLYTDDTTADVGLAHMHGTVDYWDKAPYIFRHSKINLNLTLRSIRSGIPQRVWDILGAGGFCITNYQPELGLYFENGKDLVYFEDLADLERKVKYYLEHDKEREQIAKNGYQKVKSLHQYADRFDAIRKWIPEI